MADIAWTLLVHLVGLVGFAALARAAGRRIEWAPLSLALVAMVIYVVAEVGGALLQSALPLMRHLHWTWLGKLLAVVVTLVFIGLTPGMDRREVGLTIRQRPASLVPALTVLALTCVFSWAAEAMAHDGTNLHVERLLFQATMPGLDEELFWRGLLLALLTRAFGEGPKLGGARFGLAEVAVTLLFAAGHGLRVQHGALSLDVTTCFVTGVIGAALMWLRRRTDSLVFPVLAHNVSNFGNSFF